MTRFFVHVVVIATLTLPLKATAQQNASTAEPSAKPVRLSDAGFQRLYGRLMGEWQLNNRKSSQFTDPLPPEKYIYSPVDGSSVRYTSALGVSVQHYDGKHYPKAAPSGHTATVARTPVDEYTVDNITTLDGKPDLHNTQYLSPDGEVMLLVGRRINERGEEVLSGFAIYDKVPSGTVRFATAPPATAK